MKIIITALIVCTMMSMLVVGVKADLKMTPMIRDMIDRHVSELEEWAAANVIVNAVSEQNKKGIIPGMNNQKWRKLRRRDQRIKAFSESEAGRFLQKKIAESNGMISQLVLSAATGEKVAFANKPLRYISKGQLAFDISFKQGTMWRGEPIFDTSIQTYVLIVSAPVMVDNKPAGVLTMSIQFGHLEKMKEMNNMEKMKH